MMDKVDLIESDMWDHYSGLPNPSWYQYRSKLSDDEEDTEDKTNSGTDD